MLQRMESASKGMHKAKASCGQACSTSEDCGFVEERINPCSRSRVQVNTCKAQELAERSSWELHSLEEALTSLELMPQPPSVKTFTCILHNCRNKKNLVYAKRIHAYMCKSGLETHGSLGNHLVPMLVELGSMSDAQHVFNRLLVRNVYSWTSLITGYIECGESLHALNLYQKMQDDLVDPNEFTFMALLKACGELKDAERAREIHREIARKGLERDTFIGNMLVHMYAKCELITEAREVFDKLPVRDVVSWTAVISGYAKHGLGNEALNCFEQMQLEGISPNAATFVCTLKACGGIGAIDKGQEMHVEVARMGLERDLVVGSTLVDMYAKCDSSAKAQEVFDRLPVRNKVSWNALITGYAKQGLGEEALNCFEQMQREGVSPNAVTYACSLKACGSIGAIHKGLEIHSEIARKGWERDLVVGSTLVDMYVKCGWLAKAWELFVNLPVRNVISWTALIAGFAKHGLDEEALYCFEQMQLEGVSPNAVTYVCSLKACSSIGAIDKGREIHRDIFRKGLLERHPFIGNALVDMYAKCGLHAKAREVFDKLSIRNEVSWNALITGYAEYGHGEEALIFFQQMQMEGISPNAVTFICSLKACGSIGAIDKGQEIHAEIAHKGLERDIVVGSALVDMYAKCGSPAKTQEVFDTLPVRNEVSWNALIAGYTRHGLGDDALNCFKQMQLEGIPPSTVTFVCSLKACGSIGVIDKGCEIHAVIAGEGLERDLIVGSSLVDMYAKCGSLAKAQETFDKLPVQNVVCWTALIAGYVKHGLGEEALDCFEQMQLEGISPDALTFICSLQACGSIGAVDKGQEIHDDIAKKGWLGKDPCVGNALVAMYSNFGLLEKAWEVFHKLPIQDVVSWNALITGYAHIGETQNVFHMLDRMRSERIKPDRVTFLSVLRVCSHTGLVDKGQRYFEAMSKDYSITPTLEHHTCMVDLLGRAGQLDQAMNMMSKMPFNPDLVVWHSVLGACRKWGNVELGRHAFKHAVQLDDKDAAAYVFISNIYAHHMQEEVE